ncbi:MAG TPA: thioredoxin [Anaerolineae bacterium]|nr:thioredoxin [Anaerolineae bacterium]HIQ11644.1 thioredoxin [Caldilineales bacterium]
MPSLFEKLFGGKEEKSQPSPSPQPQVDRPKPVHVTDVDFDDVIMKSDKLAIVDLWAEWCSPCHLIAPIIEDLAAEYEGRVVVAKLDVDHNPNTPARFGIMGIPTVLFIKNGREVDRIVGAQSYVAFANKVEKWLDA